MQIARHIYITHIEEDPAYALPVCAKGLDVPDAPIFPSEAFIPTGNPKHCAIRIGVR